MYYILAYTVFFTLFFRSKVHASFGQFWRQDRRLRNSYSSQSRDIRENIDDMSQAARNERTSKETHSSLRRLRIVRCSRRTINRQLTINIVQWNRIDASRYGGHAILSTLPLFTARMPNKTALLNGRHLIQSRTHITRRVPDTHKHTHNSREVIEWFSFPRQRSFTRSTENAAAERHEWTFPPVYKISLRVSIWEKRLVRQHANYEKNWNACYIFRRSAD